MDSLAPRPPRGCHLSRRVRALAFIAAMAGCHPGLAAEDWRPRLIEIPAGPFIAGSDAAERDYACRPDAAGQVFEWTATPAGDARAFVKGGSWDDKGCGVCRPAARHARPVALKHILVGFRLARDP